MTVCDIVRHPLPSSLLPSFSPIGNYKLVSREKRPYGISPPVLSIIQSAWSFGVTKFQIMISSSSSTHFVTRLFGKYVAMLIFKINAQTDCITVGEHPDI